MFVKFSPSCFRSRFPFLVIPVTSRRICIFVAMLLWVSIKICRENLYMDHDAGESGTINARDHGCFNAACAEEGRLAWKVSSRVLKGQNSFHSKILDHFSVQKERSKWRILPPRATTNGHISPKFFYSSLTACLRALLLASWMLQGRLFSYNDTHRHRLGANYEQLPVNRPFNTSVQTYQRDGENTLAVSATRIYKIYIISLTAVKESCTFIIFGSEAGTVSL